MRITTRLSSDGATIAVVGDIDHEILPAFGEAIAQAVEQPGQNVVLDFSAVTYTTAPVSPRSLIWQDEQATIGCSTSQGYPAR